MFEKIKNDIRVVKDRDPAATSSAQVFFLYHGFHAILYYRIANWLYRHRRYFLARWVSQHAKFKTGIEIHPAAQIGEGLFIDHGAGVVIGETTVIGKNCVLYQGVTLGGTGKDSGKRHPTLGDNVMVGAGAKVLGPFTVGSGAKIAAGAVVLDEIPAGATAVGVPARVVRVDGKRLDTDLDQIHIADPISQELCRMSATIERLQKQVNELKKEKDNETV